MKLYFTGLLMLSTLSAFATEELLEKCATVAERAVTKKVGWKYDRNGIWAFQCVIAPNNAAFICELGASKGDGAAVDTYRAVLNKTCTKTFRVDLIGEE